MCHCRMKAAIKDKLRPQEVEAQNHYRFKDSLCYFGKQSEFQNSLGFRVRSLSQKNQPTRAGVVTSGLSSRLRRQRQAELR